MNSSSKFCGGGGEEYPSGFWDDVVVPINTIKDCVTGEKKIADLPKPFHKFMKRFISKEIFDSVKLLQVRGNGWCSVNAMLASLIKIYPSLSSMKYEEIIDLFRMFLSDEGFHDQNPNDLDADLICKVMRNVLSTFGLLHASFAIFSTVDNTVKFSTDYDSVLEKDLSSDHQENLFLILHEHGHFSGLYLIEPERIKLYGELVMHQFES